METRTPVGFPRRITGAVLSPLSHSSKTLATDSVKLGRRIKRPFEIGDRVPARETLATPGVILHPLPQVPQRLFCRVMQRKHNHRLIVHDAWRVGVLAEPNVADVGLRKLLEQLTVSLYRLFERGSPVT